MRRSRKIAWIVFALVGLPFLLVAVAIAVFYGATAHSARGGDPMLERTPVDIKRPTTDDTSSQILFGDLHVHTNYSADSFLQSYQIPKLDSRRTPADACNFARFCSQLDFWSINDHAESLTPKHWQATIDAVRACDATAGGPNDSDLVSFLGWEWSHASLTADDHYGHKNVVLADLDDGKIPTRPIASASGPPWPFIALGTAGVLTTDAAYSDFKSFHRYVFDTFEVEDCPADTPAPELPSDCRESATTPAELFRKLDEWNLRALVIPHGLTWGTTNPTHARLDGQLKQHDPKWQRLLEVYSGHGNSEVFADFERPTQNAEGRWNCPEATPEMEFCCVRAAELARKMCEDPTSASCLESIDKASQQAAAVDAGAQFDSPIGLLPGKTAQDWGQCGQLDRRFLSSWNYRPRQSAQYALALGTVDGAPVENRFRFGFIGSSDTHRGRPGTGYSEKGRLIMTDGVGYPLPEGLMDDRQDAFYFSGGLAAVHAPRRNRDAVFDALSRREVYGTSGDRILLWFDYFLPGAAGALPGAAGALPEAPGAFSGTAGALSPATEALPNAAGERRPMGTENILAKGTPRFVVRAVGAHKQRPGCPEFVHDALGEAEVRSLCLDQCHYPSDERKRITRIEVVRIAPQASANAPVAQAIEDPWRVFECPADPEGCTVEFEDPDYAESPREVAYYVRAIQEPSLAINGDPLSCERDDEGRCVSATLCEGETDGRPNDCLAPAEERAWSSPIFLRPRA